MSIPSFDHLTADIQVTAKSKSVYTFYEIEGEPWIEVYPATETNKRYTNAVLEQSGKMLQRLQGRKMTTRMIEDARKEDRPLYAQLVATGRWGVIDAHGNQLEFTADVCEAFFNAIPNRLFDGLRKYCGNESNFTAKGAQEAPTPEEEEQLGES